MNPFKKLTFTDLILQSLNELSEPFMADIGNALVGGKCMWVAKNRITNETYGKTFESAYEAYEYIQKDLYYLNRFLKLVEEEKDKIFKTNYNGSSIIQCYNITQKRWADGFDM